MKSNFGDDDSTAIGPETVPRLLRCDATRMTLDRQQAFVLSQIDGRSSVDDLTSLVGLGLAEVCAAVLRLHEIGAVELGEPERRATREASRRRRSDREPSRQSDREAVAVDVFGARAPRPRTSPSLRPPHVVRNRIASARRPSTEPPALAAPTPTADELDALERALLASLHPPADPSSFPDVAIPAAPAIPAAAPLPSAPAIPPARASAPAVPPALPSEPGKRARIRVETGRFHRAAGPVSLPAPVAAVAAPEAPPDSIRHDGRAHARVFLDAGEQELSRGNFVAAAMQFQLALKCCDTPEIRQALDAVEEMARPLRFQTLKGQGEAAEREARWGDAVTAYTKAHAIQPDARIAERLANALRLSDGDLRAAARLAEEAVQREPTSAGFRTTLAEVYADAGLDIRAKAELKRALELAPDEPRAVALSARLAKSGGR